MNEVRQYVEAAAPDDVRETVAWLEDSGYRLVSTLGGPGESFGDAMLVFGSDRQIEIVQDRGQWFIAVAFEPGGSQYTLDLLLAAMGNRPWVPSEQGESLPRQLPAGLSWREALPGILEWMAIPAARVAAERTDGQAIEYLRHRWDRS